MKNYQFTFFLIFACCLSFNITYSQGFQIPNDTCPNVPIEFISPINTAANYQWDFCVGDLSNTPNVSVVNSGISKSLMSRAEGMTTVFDGTNWYGFVTSWTGRTLTRISYGVSLENTPTIVNLGNIGGAFTIPRSIKVFKEGSNWYGIVLNVAGTIVRLNFGTDLSSTPTATTLPNITEVIVPAGLDVVRDETNTYIVVINYNLNTPNLVILDFGSTINKLVPDMVTTTSTLPFREGFTVRATKNNGQWYAFATNVLVNDPAPGHSPEIIIASFGNNLHNATPSYRSFMPNTTINQNYFWQVIPLQDGTNRIAFGITPSGNIYRLVFGDSFDNTPTITNIGRFGVIGGTITLGETPSNIISFAKQDSRWYGFTLNSNDPNIVSQLIRIEFPEVSCNATQNFIESTGTPNVNNTFITSTKYRVSLNATNADGISIGHFNDSLSISALITPAFNISNRCLGETTNFINNSIGNDTDVMVWEWDFGDGSTSNDKNPTHAYSQPGTYTISLTPRTASGLCDNALTKEINVRSVPKASFEIKDKLAANTPINLTNTSTNFTKNSNTTFQWIVDDGGGFRYFDENPTHTFSQPGNYQIILSVTDTIGGCTSVASQSVTVGAIPEVDFTLNQKACTQNAITLMDASSVTDVVGSTIVSYQWNFGGGVADQSLSTRPDTLANPVVTFGFATDFEISLTVTTNLGISNTIKRVIAFEDGLTSQMTASITSGDVPLSVNFTNQNSSAVSHLWDFGDGNTSTEPNPSHVYTSSGIYTVTYQAFAANGCSTPKTLQIIASAPNDVLEVSLNDFNIVGDQLLVSVTNNGNTPITSLNLRRILNKQDTLQWQWTGLINSLASETISLNLNSGQGAMTWHACVNILNINSSIDAKTTDNRLCKNTLDAQISSALVQDNQYLIVIRNNATVPIQNLNIQLDVGSQQFTQTTWTGTINANEQVNILGNLTNEELQGAPYFCATITQINDTTDANTQNNLACQDFSNDLQILSISPNPATDFINIEYFLPQTQDQDVVSLQVIGSSGSVKGSVQLLNLLPGRNLYRYHTSGLASGVYHLMFIRGNLNIVKKIVIK